MTTTIQNKKTDNHAATTMHRLIKLTGYFIIVKVILFKLNVEKDHCEKQREASQRQQQQQQNVATTMQTNQPDNAD